MLPETDRILDRRRLKRGLTFWRVVAILAIVAAVLAGVARFDDLVGRDYVARLSVGGIILDDPDLTNLIDEVAADADARALIVSIDSPGGTFVGGEGLYHALRRAAEAMPVVAVIGDTGTSGAYLTALGADRIVASRGSITGSIGVILQTADVTGLLDKIGIKPETVKSGPLKAQPNPLEPFSDEARANIEGVIADLHDAFVGFVAERRGLSPARARALADGRVFTGRQALESGLVDALGGEREARRWLADARDVPESLPARDVEPPDETLPWDALFGKAAQKILFSERLKLDGFLALWHPQLMLP